MLNIAPAVFAGANAPLEPELAAMLQSALQPAQEHTLLQVQTAPGQALIATTARIIVLKAARNSETGKALGRYFPWTSIEQIEAHGGLFTRSLVIVTADTRTERRPFTLARCSFAVTFSGFGLFGNVRGYLTDALATLHQMQQMNYINGPLAPITPPPGVIALHGERFFLTADAVLYAQHTYRQWQGGTQGMSFRVMRGVYYRVGGIRGRSYNQSVTEPDDRGMLALSDRRVLFVGAHKTIDLPLARIASIQPFTDGLQVNVANKAPVQLQTGNNLAGLMLQRLCTNPPP